MNPNTFILVCIFGLFFGVLCGALGGAMCAGLSWKKSIPVMILTILVSCGVTLAVGAVAANLDKSRAAREVEKSNLEKQ